MRAVLRDCDVRGGGMNTNSPGPFGIRGWCHER